MAKKLTGKLTVADIGSLGPGTHGDGNNLYLQIRSATARSWLFRYMIAGRRYEMGIGPARRVTLDDARRRADELNRQVGGGINPMQAKLDDKAGRKVEAIKRITFREVAAGYIAAHEGTWRSTKHRAQWGATLATYVYPAIGSAPVSQVDTEMVLAILSPIWAAKLETASRVRGRIESVLDYAKALGYREGDNPARWRGHMSNLLPKKSKVRAVKHHPALPYSEIAPFIAELQSELTVHGFRSTFRDWAGEATSFEHQVVETALAHVTGNKTETAYARGDLLDKRRALMTAWASFCAGKPGADVVALRA
jgi:integrase